MRGNILFNFLARILTALSTFLFIPFYISILGADGFAVFAFSLIVVSILLVLDIGLSAAIGREMARKDITDAQRYRAFRAIEKVYLALLFLAAIIGLVFAGPIARNLIGETPIDRDIIALCLTLIAIEAGLQLLMRFYVAVLIGLERQIRGNMFTLAWTALRNGAVILVIWQNPSIVAFFTWQLGATLAIVIALKLHSRGHTSGWPWTAAPFFDIETLTRIKGFALGMLLISLVTVANTQLDRILIGSLESMRDLAAYTLSASMGTAMLIAATPIMIAVQPRLTAYFTEDKAQDARALFQKASRFVALLVFPPGVIVALHPEAVILAWTGEAELASLAAGVTPFLVAANALIAIATIAYAAALANGYTRFNNVIGIVSLFVSIPGYALAVRYSGMQGVAMVYFGIQFASTLIFSWLVMRRFFGGGFWRHQGVNHAIPGLAAFGGAWLFSEYLWVPQDDRALMLLLLFAGVVFSGLISLAVSTSAWKVIDARSGQVAVGRSD